MRKQIIASVLASGFALSSVPAIAQIPQEIKGTRYEEAVSVLSALNIMNGDENGEYRLGDTIIRSELVKMAVTAMGMEAAAQTSKDTSNYTDVTKEHWANGYINVATSLGIVEGDGDGNFRPNAPISYREAVTVMVRAAGYETAAQARGGYPNGYITIAGGNKMLSGVEGQAENPITRGNVAVLTNNTLETKKMEQTGFGAVPEYGITDKTLLSDNLKTDKFTGQVKAIGAMTLSGVSAVNEDSIMIDDKVYKNSSNANVLGYTVSAYAKRDSYNEQSIILAYPIKGKNASIEITANRFDQLTKKNTNDAVMYFEKESDARSKTAVIDSNAQIIYNNRSVEYNRELLDIADKAAFMTLLDVDTDGKIDIIFITEYENFVVDYVSSSKITDTSNKTIKLDEIDYKIYQGFNEINISDVKKWDIISIVKSPSDNYHEMYLTRNTVSGRISAKNKDGYTINDVNYRTAKSFKDTLSIGQRGEFCLDINGDIAAVKNVSTVTNSYAYLTNAYKTNAGDVVELKVVDKSGEKMTLALANKVKLNGETVNTEVVFNTLVKNGKTDKQLVTYVINSSGAVTEINIAADKSASGEADEDNFTLNKRFTDTVYKSDTSKLGNIRVTNDTIVFDISDEDDIRVDNKSIFANNQKYTGIVYDMSESFDAGVIVLSDTAYKPEIDSSIAVVKSLSSGINSDDIQTDIITVLKDGKESKLYAKNDSILTKDGSKKLETGDIIQYKTNGKGEIAGIRVLFDISKKGTEFTNEPEKDLEIVYGSITKKFTNSINVSVGGNSSVNYSIDNETTVYSVDTSNNRGSVKTATIDDLAVFDGDEGNRVFIKIVENKVTEIVIVR